ncbi:phage tail protein [Mesorhizobium sp. SP-1A]|uniref:phage tail protein n=1 Tax=Mesorhizobium sp. SP-1A TaxID=3077840 RepID=UPI0028F6F4BF|nr:phage tail protein [Mesorhizobium sp. SP-1A]
MKPFKVLALAGVCLPALTAHAFADPVSIGSFVISSLLSVGAGGILPAVSAAAIGNFVIGAALVGASLLQSVLGRAPKIDPGNFKSTFETGDSSEIRAVGRVRVGGLKAFGNTAGGVNRYRLVCHTRGKVTAVEQHFFGGREITVESDGSVSSPPWARSNGSSWAYVKAKIGDGTETAWPELLADFPDLWTPAHRVRGIAQSLVKYISPGITSDKFLKLYQSGAPDYERVQRSEPVYDPRSGQSATNEATWAYRDNGPLCAAHILRSYPSLKVSDFDYAGIAAEATRGDAIVATKAGTEVRSRCWGMWPSETPRGDVMDQVLKSIGAEIVPSDDNSFTIRLIDDWREPEIVFPEKHLIELQWRSGPESVERPNICRVKYYAPERNYEMTEIDLTGIEWAHIQSEIDRVGEQIMDIDLPFCPSASQAQRIARRLFALARADAGVAKFNFVGLAAWGKTVAGIPLPDIGVTETCAIGTPRVNDDEGTVEIPFVVWPDLPPWNPATMEVEPPPVVPDMAYDSALDTPASPSAAAVVQYPGGAYETRLKFAGVTGGTVADAVFRAYTAGEPDPYQRMTTYKGGSDWYGYKVANPVGKKTDFKVRFFNDDDDGSYFSDVLTVDPMAIDNTAPAKPELIVGKTIDFPPRYTVTASVASMNAVSLIVTGSDLGVIISSEGRPGQTYTVQFTVDDAGSHLFEATAYNSNGTAGPVASYSI